MENELYDSQINIMENAFKGNNFEESKPLVNSVDRTELLNELKDILDLSSQFGISRIYHFNSKFPKEVLYSIDEVIDSMNNQYTESNNESIINRIRDYYQNIKYNLFEFKKEYSQNNFVDFIKEYFKDGVDLITADNLEIIEEDITDFKAGDYIVKDENVYTDEGKKILNQDMDFVSFSDSINYGNGAEDSTDGIFKLKMNNGRPSKAVSFVYTSSSNILKFRFEGDTVQIIYNEQVREAFKYIQVTCANAAMSLHNALTARPEVYFEAYMAASTLLANNTVYAPASNIFELLRISGMNKYEQIGYLSYYLNKTKCVSEDYPGVNYSLLNKFKDGIPEEVITMFNLDEEAPIDSLRVTLDSAADILASNEDQKVITYYNTARLYIDIIDENLDCGNFARQSGVEQIISISSLTDLLFKVMLSENLKSFDQIINFVKVNNLNLLPNKNTFHYTACALEYYNIIDSYARTSKRLLFLREIVREPSFSEAAAQNDIGFRADIFTIDAKDASLTNSIKKIKSKDGYSEFSTQVLLSYISQAFMKELSKSNMSGFIKSELAEVTYMPGYYLLEYLYYAKKDIIYNDSPVSIMKGNDEFNIIVRLDMGKLKFPISNEVLKLEVPSNLILDLYDHLDKGDKAIITEGNYISIPDYLRTRYRYIKTSMIQDYTLVNACVDYHKITNREKMFEIESVSCADSKKNQFMGVAGSSELVLFGGEATRVINECGRASARKFQDLSGDELEAFDMLDDCLHGNSIPGFTRGCIPLSVYFIVFYKKFILEKKAYNHIETWLDFVSEDLQNALQYKPVKVEEVCSVSEAASRRDIAFTGALVPTSVTIDRTAVTRNVIDFTKVNKDGAFKYSESNRNIYLYNKYVAFYDGSLYDLDDVNFLSEYAFKVNENMYILDLTSSLISITMKETINV